MSTTAGWQDRAPRSLLVPYHYALDALEWLYGIGRCQKKIAEAVKNKGRRQKSRAASKGSKPITLRGQDAEELMGWIAALMARFRPSANRGDQALAQVEEVFGSVAVGVPEFAGSMAPSFHRLAINMAKAIRGKIVRALKLPSDDNVKNLFEQGTSEELEGYLIQKGELQAGFPEGMEWADFCHLWVQLEQELFRAWTYAYTPGPCAAEFNPSAENLERWKMRDTAATSRRRSGPAYQRNLLWLKWSEQEGMTPAPILDRWNGMSDAQRQAIAPFSWRQVKSKGERKGARGNVKKNIENAKKKRDKGATGEN